MTEQPAWLVVLQYDSPDGFVVLGWCPTRDEVHDHHRVEHPDATIVAVCPGTLDEYEQNRARLAPHRFQPEVN